MICRHIPKKKNTNDNIKRLALYLTQEKINDIPKCTLAWSVMENEITLLNDQDDLTIAIDQMVATQKENTRVKEEKTYHLVISFTQDEMAKLNQNDLMEIEKKFAKTLGLEDHERICALHENTDNPHIQVAYNLIHPETYKKANMFRDHLKIERTLQTLQKELGFKLTHDSEQKEKPVHHYNEAEAQPKKSNRAILMEKHSNKESLESYAQKHAKNILLELRLANNWQEVHHVFQKYGLELKPKGQGAIIKNINGDETIKASQADRGLSFNALIKQFGEFKTAEKEALTPPEFVYTKEPLLIKTPTPSLPSLEYEAEEIVEVAEVAEVKMPVETETEKPVKKEPLLLFAQRHAKNIVEKINNAQNWQEAHSIFKEYNLEFRLKGNGAVLKNLTTREEIKASECHRSLSLHAMKQRFGEFERPQLTPKTQQKIESPKSRVKVHCRKITLEVREIAKLGKREKPHSLANSIKKLCDSCNSLIDGLKPSQFFFNLPKPQSKAEYEAMRFCKELEDWSRLLLKIAKFLGLAEDKTPIKPKKKSPLDFSL